jgi:hypothetical protein
MTQRFTREFVGALLLACAVGANAAGATTWLVPGDGFNVCTIADPNCDTIQQAVTAATDNDTILIGPGSFSGPGNFAIILDKTLTITGDGRASTSIEPDVGSFGFSIRADDVSISDLAIDGGANGINFESAPSDNAQLTRIDLSNSTSRGINIAVAGLANAVTGVVIDDCAFTSLHTGIRMASDSQVDGLTISNSTFTTNSYAIYQANDGNSSTLANLSITDCEFTDNTLYAIYAEEMRDATIEGTTFVNNRVAIQLNKIYATALAAGNINITGNAFSAHTFSTINLEVTNSGLESDITVADNTIGLDVGTLAFNAAGIFVGLGHAHTHAPVYITENAISLAGTFGGATAAFGVRVRRNGPVVLTSNTLDGGGVGGTASTPATSGLYIEANATAGAMPASAVITASCNSITGFRNGVSIYDAPGGVYGGLVAGATVTLDGNDITGNSDFGVINGAGSETVDAQGNWWGCGAGPGNLGCDDVSGPVDATSPAPTAEPCDNQCPPAPDACRTPLKSSLSINDKLDDNKDKLSWKWNKGEATTQSEFGDPTTSANYSLCIYGNGALVGQSLILADGIKWSTFSTKGYKYKDKLASVDGIKNVTLKAGVDDKAKLSVKGKGGGLPDLTLPIAAPVAVQLRNNDSELCWGAEFSALQLTKNELGKLKGKVK